MNLKPAERKRAPIKMALQGSSGSGKTMSALHLAHGLESDWSKIAVIDTEAGSSHLYAHLGSFQVLSLDSPYTPERYIEAMELCIESGIEVIILDSITHCWEFLLDYHGSLQGNSFANWNKVTPRHRAFVDKILQLPAHVIATMRSKTEYALSDKNGKMVPEKLGLKAVQRDGIDYEFTLVFDLDINHQAKATKDRTSIFSDKPEFIITPQTGKIILDWCNTGTTLDEVRKAIMDCTSVEGLNDLYRRYPAFYSQLEQHFRNKKAQLLQKHSSTSKSIHNGIDSVRS